MVAPRLKLGIIPSYQDARYNWLSQLRSNFLPDGAQKSVNLQQYVRRHDLYPIRSNQTVATDHDIMKVFEDFEGTCFNLVSLIPQGSD